MLIGTTKNFVLQGSLDGDFIPITQVRSQNLSSVSVNENRFSFFMDELIFVPLCRGTQMSCGVWQFTPGSLTS